VADLPRAVFDMGSRLAWGFPANSFMVQDVTEEDDFRDWVSALLLLSVVDACFSGLKRSSSNALRRPLAPLGV